MIFDLVSHDTPLKLATRSQGGVWRGPCPKCGGEDRFHVWETEGRYWCRGCGKTGDEIQYLRDFRGLSYREAARRVGKSLDEPPPPPPVVNEIQELEDLADELESWNIGRVYALLEEAEGYQEQIDFAGFMIRAGPRFPDLFSSEDFAFWCAVYHEAIDEQAQAALAACDVLHGTAEEVIGAWQREKSYAGH